MNDYEVGYQSGLEKAVNLALANMRQDRQKFQDYIGSWNAQKHTDWVAIKKANETGFTLHQSASTAGMLINLLSPLLATRDFAAEKAEVDDVFESLSSWDLYTSFGWDYDTHMAHK